MSAFYKMDPAAWDYGTADLSLEEEAAYLRIVNAINKHDSPVPNLDRVLAGMFRCSTRKARAILARLIEAEKVYIEDGKIWNERARSEVVHRHFASVSSAERGAKGGRKRAENAAKALKTMKATQANPSSRIEENRIYIYRFDEFWEIYPHRGGAERNRKGAEKKYESIVKRGVSEETIISGAKRSHDDRRVKDGFARDPVTWLNQEGWTDDIEPSGSEQESKVFKWDRIARKG